MLAVSVIGQFVARMALKKSILKMRQFSLSNAKHKILLKKLFDSNLMDS